MQIFNFQLLFVIFSQIKIIRTDYPLIEILSFGIDIRIQCNETYFQFDEINNNISIWRFAHPSSFCQTKEKVESVVNECGVQSIDGKYLKVHLMKTLHSKITKHYEYASVYCPINYKPIAPMINVRRSGDKSDSFYRFNLTATGLEQNQSFEILSAKRVHSIHSKSLNYWFSPKCIIHEINILENTNHSIVFTISDSIISQVEFLIRRCHQTCRKYEKCLNDYEPSMDDFIRTYSMEKINCNKYCLEGNIPLSSSPQTIMKNISSSTIELSHEKQMIKSFIYYFLFAFFFIIIFIIIACFLLYRTRGIRTDNVYSKTTSINIDENKEINEE